MVNRWIEKVRKTFPEQRLFLKSDEGTRFLRLSTQSQLGLMTGGALVLGWTIFSTSVLLMDSLGSGTAREQSLREQAVYGQRLNALSQERDARVEEARMAQERFYVAMEQISAMQIHLLKSEERRTEMETGIEVIQATLRTVMKERDEARENAALVMAELEAATGTSNTQTGMLAASTATIEALADRLLATAEGRDTKAIEAKRAEREIEDMVFASRLADERNEQIFQRLEEAATVSLEPLQGVFEQAGLPTARILDEVRRGYNGQGGPLVPLSVSSKTPDGVEVIDPLAERANEILEQLDEVNTYRMAVEMTPLYQPVQSAFRFTSPFGYRRDPKTGGRRMHNGTDFAAPLGTPIMAAADGVVVKAGWGNGYGRMVKLRHAFGIETWYAHMTRVRVSEGQRVSQGDRIGDMGTTGRSTGVHLHYEVRQDGKPLNPMNFIRAGQNVF